MKKKRNSLFSLSAYLRWPIIMSVILVLLNGALAAVDIRAALCMLVFTAIFVIVSLYIYIYSRKGIYTGLIDFSRGFETAESKMLSEVGMPSAIADRNGRLLWKNRAFAELFMEGGPSNIQGIFADVTKEVLQELSEISLVHSTFDGRRYLVELCPSRLNGGEEDEDGRQAGFFEESGRQIAFITVSDETELLAYKKLYEDSRPCEGLIYLDNYDEALSSLEDVRSSLLTALIDRRISGYINSLGGIVKKLEKDKYFFYINNADAERMIADKFSILDEVKTISIGNDISVTISVGLGRGGDDLNDNYEYARAAIEFALGRGGDQAVLKDSGNVVFFGGKTEAKEKHARVKARVKAQALRDLLNTCDKVLVMGHKNADVDSLGSAVGFWRIAKSLGKKCYVVIGKPTRSLEPIYNKFLESRDYPDGLFINGEEALDILDDQTLLTVVDVNRPSITEEPRLLKRAKRISLIDHHRISAEGIASAVLTYIEPSASSACELITEIIEYMGDIELTSLEADTMYGGIMIDTQNFINQTGVRTFEAAAYLKKAGASSVRVRKLLRDSRNDYRAKAEAVDKAEIYKDYFVFSVCNAQLADSPTVIGAQAANSLLEMDGIKAAIVLTPYNGLVYVSARSIDDVNVQVMMEHLGGGGHMTVAGAQVPDTTVEEAMRRIKSIIDGMQERGEIS